MKKTKYDLELEKQRRELNTKSKASLIEKVIELEEKLDYTHSDNDELREEYKREITDLKVAGYDVLMRYFKK